MRTERTTYLSADGGTSIPAYVAAPDGPGPHPAVLILRGVAGPEDGYTEIAERLAGWGYLALLHGWKMRGDDPPDATVEADIAGALAFLRSLPSVDRGRLAVFGFCRGGVHALMAATSHADIRLAVVFHGFAFRPSRARPGLEPYDLAQSVSVPTLILHGTRDEQAPIEGMRRLEARVREAGRPFEFRYYEGARHGFAVRTHPGFDAPTAQAGFEEARKFIDARMSTR
ncbi:MAG TPA: dienelactone hydrolase family protein [Burkholderiales bacterium]